MIREKINKNHGASLGEVLVAVLIMSFVGLIIVGGIFTFSRSLRTIRDKANAEVLASNTEVLLRYYLKYTNEVVFDDENETSEGKLVVKVGVMDGRDYEFLSPDDGSITLHISNGDEEQDIPLVNDASNLKRMRTSFSEIRYKDGVFIVKNMKVTYKNDKTNELMSIPEIKVKARWYDDKGDADD